MREIMIKAAEPKDKWTPDAVRSLRQRYGETQAEFAEHFRTSVEAVRIWEQGKRSVSNMASVILDQLERALAEKAGAK